MQYSSVLTLMEEWNAAIAICSDSQASLTALPSPKNTSRLVDNKLAFKSLSVFSSQTFIGSWSLKCGRE